MHASTWARIARLESTVVEGSKLCRTCGKAKPLDQFYGDRTHRDGLGSQCKVCNRHAAAERMRHRRSQRTLEQMAESSRKRRASPKGREWLRHYQHSARGKLMHSKHQASYQLRWTTDPARQRRLKNLILKYEQELARIDRHKGG